jgi:hypothetical protein
MREQAILAGVGLLLGVGAVAWIRPENPGGVALVIVVTIAVVNVTGALVAVYRKRK